MTQNKNQKKEILETQEFQKNISAYDSGICRFRWSISAA